MLRSLLSGVMRSRSRAPMGAAHGSRGSGSAVGGQVGRSLFSMLRRR